MSDFVGTPPFLKIVLLVDMEIMHFHIAGIRFGFRNMFFVFRGSH